MQSGFFHKIKRKDKKKVMGSSNESDDIQAKYNEMFKKEIVIKNKEILCLVRASLEDGLDYLEYYEE